MRPLSRIIGRLLCGEVFVYGRARRGVARRAQACEIRYWACRTLGAPCIAVALTVAVLCGCELRAGNIVYPWRATTAIVKAGERFPVWFVADEGQRVSAITLQGPYHAVAATQTVELGSWVYDRTSENRYNTRIQVAVPAGTPTDRYDLVLHTSSGEVRSAGAVKVVNEYATDYYLLHLSDTHAFQHGNEAVLQKLSAIVEMANIIGPELVFVTGDNLYRPTEQKMDQFFNGDRASGTKGLNGFSAATFIACGNHDYDMDGDKAKGNYGAKAVWYNRWWGLQSHHFAYGEGRFMVINNGWDGFDPAWQIEEAQAWLQTAGPGNFRMAGAHIRTRKIDVLHKQAGLKLALLGHNHHLAPSNPSLLGDDPIQYIANSVREYCEFNLFRVDGRTGRVTPVGGPTARVEVMPHPKEGASATTIEANLTRKFSRPNDGTSDRNVATLVNRLEFPLSRARLRFVMPKGASYAVSSGTIEQAFDGASCRIVDVCVDVGANSTVSVAIGVAGGHTVAER